MNRHSEENDREERPARNTTPAAILLIALCVITLLALPGRPLYQQQTLSARGYVSIVNEIFLNNEWLETAPPMSVAETEQGQLRPVLQLSSRAQREPRVLAFVRSSYLAHDLTREQPVIWRIENGQVLGLTPSAHVLELPSLPLRTWQGDLLFADNAQARVRRQLATEGGGVIILQQADIRTPPRPSDAVGFDIRRGANQRSEGALIRIEESASQNRRALQIADLSLIGDTVVVAVQQEGAQYYSVSVDSVVINPGEIRAITPGGSLRVTGSRNGVDGVWVLTETIDSSPQISLFRPWGEERQRTEQLASLPEAIEISLGRIVGDREGSGANLRREDVRLTLEASAQSALNTELDRFTRNEAGYLGDRYAIGVTILDAVSGDIVAMAERIRRDEALFQQDRDPNAGPPLNFNFQRLQVGSAAKPLIAAAILQERRELLDLVLLEDGQGEALRSLLGANFVVGDEEPPSLGNFRTECDFDCFIRESDNRYATALMLLANAEPTGVSRVPTPNGYSLGGVIQNSRPLSIFEDFNPDDRRSTRFVEAVRTGVYASWDRHLWSLYNIAYERRPGQESSGFLDGYIGDDTFNASIWRELMARYAFTDDSVFYGATPERENFAINQQKFFRQRMLPVMLGGGDARWTNITLAQAYARVVTGRRVSARIYNDPDTEDRPFGALPLVPAVRERVTRAMAQVATSGTAEAFYATSERWTAARDRLAQRDLVFGLFSKTGTPEIEIPIFGPRALVINQLIRLNRLRLNQSRELVWVADEERIVFSRENSVRLSQLMQRDPLARELLRRQGMEAGRVVRHLVAISSAQRSLSDYLEIEDGRLVRYLPRSTLTDYGKVYAFVVGAFPEGTPVDSEGRATVVQERLGMPHRAYAVVINIQSGVDGRDRGGGSLAVRLGAQIFDTVISDRLTNRVP